MIHKTLLLRTAVWLAGAMACAGGTLHEVQWGGIAFQTPVVFFAPTEIGMDAVALVFPAEAAPEDAAMELRLVSVPAEMLEGFGGDAAEVLLFVKSAFLGSGASGDRTVERSFLGQSVAGEVQAVTIPRVGTLETYMVPLSGGSHMVLALLRYGTTPEADGEAVLAMLAATLREDKTIQAVLESVVVK